MTHIKNFWKRFLLFLVTGSTSIFIAACYGTGSMYNKLTDGWTIITKDENNKPISGLKVTITEYLTGSSNVDTLDVINTNSEGTVNANLYMYEEGSYVRQARIVDIDAEKNGGVFLDTLITKTSSSTSNVQMKKGK